MLEMELYEVRQDETRPEQVIILKEKDGDRMMPVIIGHFEAQSMYLVLNSIEVPRPLTHDLLKRVIEQLGARLDRIVVNKLENNTFFALLVLATDNGPVEVDARPSDSICLALRTGSPIFVEEDVLSKVSIN